MANGVPPYYLPTYTQDPNRQSFQYGSPSSGLGRINSISGATGDATSYDINGFPPGYPGSSPAKTMHQGNGFPQQYGMRQPSSSISDFRDAFGTPIGSTSAQTIGTAPPMQMQGAAHQGAITHSPTSMHDSAEHGTSFGQSVQQGETHGQRQRTGSDIVEGANEEPPKKKKKVGNGSGSGTEDKEKEKEKDNRRKT